GIRRGSFQQVANAPRDDNAWPLDTAVASCFSAEDSGNVFTLAGLLAQIQTHKNSDEGLRLKGKPCLSAE
ncbi:hypothetical protein NB04_28520, partial [Pseudomonas syringae pv. tomato]